MRKKKIKGKKRKFKRSYEGIPFRHFIIDEIQIFEVVEVSDYPFFLTLEVEEGEIVADVIKNIKNSKVYLLVDHDLKRICTYNGIDSSFRLQLFGEILAGVMRRQFGLFYKIFPLNKYSMDSPDFQTILQKSIGPGRAKPINRESFPDINLDKALINALMRTLQFRQLNNTIRSQHLEKISIKGDMDRLLDGFQIPEEVKKEKQPRLSDDELRILDLESEEGINLIKQYQEETNRTALRKGKETIDFTKWLQGEKVPKRDPTMTELISIFLESVENILKSWKTKGDIDFVLYCLARFMLVYGRDYHIEFENFFETTQKWEDYNDETYPYSEILKIFYDNDYRKQFLNEYREGFFWNLRKRAFKDRDRYPYPYVFKPPEPPDDLAVAPRVQLRQPQKKKDSEEKIPCQYCGRELTKEEQLTHSCKKKPKTL